MHRALFLVVAFLVFGLSGFADTGAFHSSGDTRFPLQETSVALQRETLAFDLHREKGVDVSVDFELNNPGPDKELTLGFVTPPGSGYKVPGDRPNIDNFTVILNGQQLDFRVVQYKSNTAGLTTRFAQDGDFIFLFKARITSGINRLHHSYTFHGGTDGANCYSELTFPYRLLTGLAWANKRIDEFEYTINVTDEMLFTVPGALDSGEDQWQLSGSARKAPAVIANNRTFYDNNLKTFYKPLNVYV